MVKPLLASAIEVEAADGSIKPFGLHLMRLDPDHWKAVVHERLSFDRDAPGALHLNDAADDDYCQQLVAEARVRGPSGRYIWVVRSRENHFLDCEAMAAAAAWRLGADTLKASQVEAASRLAAQRARERDAAPPPDPAPKDIPFDPLAAARAAHAAKGGRLSRLSDLAARLNR